MVRRAPICGSRPLFTIVFLVQHFEIIVPKRDDIQTLLDLVLQSNLKQKKLLRFALVGLIEESEKVELRWKRENGSCIFGGVPVGRTGQEFGVLLRLNLLKNLKLGKMILSVGCAIAVELQFLKKRGFFAIGLDPEGGFLLEAKARDNADDLIQAIGERIPLRDGTFDLVLLFEVLEHVMKPDIVLDEINRVLKPNGTLFLTVPNRLYLFETHGIQICQKQIGNLLGIGIPFFSLAPNFLRRRLERARIYSEAGVVALLRKHCFEPFIVKYIIPPLDEVWQTPLAKATRQVFLHLNKVPIIEKFGANIIVVSKKRGYASCFITH